MKNRIKAILLALCLLFTSFAALAQLGTIGIDRLESGNAIPLGDGCWQYHYIGSDPYWGEVNPIRWLGRVYLKEDGIWYILVNDTETGRAFMASVNNGE